ncbi:PTH2 [Enterospora canceri]|uniref:peptidyl-tRNA hydrolase n=1 Tax=Enterospora canceri TaxID=1081671 RepID=A0A1Y1S5Q9_9MICR|nr:PTH2 [Enterospora canceri]
MIPLVLCTCFIIIGIAVGRRLSKQISRQISSIFLNQNSETTRSRIHYSTLNKQNSLKMVFLVNNSLGMKKGKVISQCMHAYDGIVERVMENREIRGMYSKWKRSGCAKVVVKADVGAFNGIYSKLYEYDLINYVMITDAGRTQIKAGSNTVIGIGPDYSEEIDRFTGECKLY